MSYKDPIHDRQARSLGRETRKGPDGVTLKPGREVVDGVTVYESTGLPVANSRKGREIVLPDRSVLERLFSRAID